MLVHNQITAPIEQVDVLIGVDSQKVAHVEQVIVIIYASLFY